MKYDVTQHNRAFQRIDPSHALDLHELMRDVSYEGQQKIGATTMWGKNANDILIKTQGKSFVKAKNKLKNTYRGGQLDSMTIRSHKFDASD